MSWGAVIRNPSGVIQFDSEAPAMCLRQRGVLSGTTMSVTITNAQTPLMAFRPNNCNTAIVNIVKSGNTYTYYFSNYASSTGWSIDYYLFDQPPTTAPTSGWHLVFFDASGKVTFNSQFPPMRLAKPDQLISGHIYAIAPPPGPAYREQVEAVLDSFGNFVELEYRTETGGWVRDGNSFGTSMLPSGSYGSSSNVSYDPNNSNVMLIDVTNL